MQERNEILQVKLESVHEKKDEDAPKEVTLEKQIFTSGELWDVSWHWKYKGQSVGNWSRLRSMPICQGIGKIYLNHIVSYMTVRQALFKLLWISFYKEIKYFNLSKLTVTRVAGNGKEGGGSGHTEHV